MQTLHSLAQTQAVTVASRQIVGVGNVGRTAGEATYTLYDPGTNRVQFQTVNRLRWNRLWWTGTSGQVPSDGTASNSDKQDPAHG